MKLNQDVVPTTLEEALKVLKEAMTPLEITETKKLESSELHFSLGMYLRNQWSLWDTKSKLNTWFYDTYGINHADDVSGIILECLLNDFNGKPRRDKILAKRFIAHWKKNNK
jgi:hypothetical protein